MKKAEWSERFSVKVKILDDQHKGMFEIINKLIPGDDGNLENGVVSSVINEMFRYASTHFETEEKLMRQFGYDAFESHRKQHDFFREETLKLASRSKAGERRISNELLEFLTTWLVGHILGSDAKYVSLFSEKGLS